MVFSCSTLTSFRRPPAGTTSHRMGCSSSVAAAPPRRLSVFTFEKDTPKEIRKPDCDPSKIHQPTIVNPPTVYSIASSSDDQSLRKWLEFNEQHRSSVAGLAPPPAESDPGLTPRQRADINVTLVGASTSDSASSTANEDANRTKRAHATWLPRPHRDDTADRCRLTPLKMDGVPVMRLVGVCTTTGAFLDLESEFQGGSRPHSSSSSNGRHPCERSGAWQCSEGGEKWLARSLPHRPAPSLSLPTSTVTLTPLPLLLLSASPRVPRAPPLPSCAAAAAAVAADDADITLTELGRKHLLALEAGRNLGHRPQF